MRSRRWKRLRANHFGALVSVLAVIAASVPPPIAEASCSPSDARCAFRERIAAAEQYLVDRPGTVGFVLRDRASGTRYRNGDAGTPIWTASTIKLAMVADLLTREQSGSIRLGDDDRQQMVDMLRRSDNDAADALWSRYDGPTFNANFSRY